MHYLRKGEERGTMQNDWLTARHSFSFAGYLDRAHMGFSVLRVINQDIFAPNSGFPTHPHDNMEIITYVTSGTIAHQDSTGGEGQIKAGEIQVMSAGSGIAHSEFNPSSDTTLQLLQIWIKPNVVDARPGYTQKSFPLTPGLTTLVSSDGLAGSLKIRQSAWLHRLLLEEGETSDFTGSSSERAIYIQIVKGSAVINGQELKAGDALGVVDEPIKQIVANATLEALIFDLPVV